MKLRAALMISHALHMLAVVFVAYSAKHYLMATKVVLPIVVALAEPGVGVIDDRSAAGIVLSAVQSYADFALYQLAGWAGAWVLSVAAVIAVHRAKSRVE